MPLAKRALLADTAKNALRVNNLKASRTPTPNVLLALDATGNGHETADAIRVHQRAARTLYISGYTEDEAIRVGRYESGVGFLQKPFSTDELDAKIRTLLDAVVV